MYDLLLHRDELGTIIPRRIGLVPMSARPTRYEAGEVTMIASRASLSSNIAGRPGTRYFGPFDFVFSWMLGREYAS